LSGSSVGRERRSDTAEGGGSIPPRTTTCQRHWPCSSVARAPACRAGGHGFESRHGRLCHDVPRGISSVGRAPVLQAGGQGFDSPILHSLNMSGGVAERYCSSLLASRRFTRGWGFESLRLRNGNSLSHGGRGVTATRWSVTPQSMGSTPSDRPNALVAQRIAHRFPGPGVAGSNPADGTSRNATNPCSSTERVPVYEAEDGSSILSRGT
jgi:hypothetical protein